VSRQRPFEQASARVIAFSKHAAGTPPVCARHALAEPLPRDPPALLCSDACTPRKTCVFHHRRGHWPKIRARLRGASPPPEAILETMSSPGTEEASPSPEYSGPEGSDNGDIDMTADQKTESPETKPNGTAKSNAKDPTRPRRKKARRACFACQRAHLTCGESILRPCLGPCTE
jgi:hypothetical protein